MSGGSCPGGTYTRRLRVNPTEVADVFHKTSPLRVVYPGLPEVDLFLILALIATAPLVITGGFVLIPATILLVTMGTGSWEAALARRGGALVLLVVLTFTFFLGVRGMLYVPLVLLALSTARAFTAVRNA